MCIDHRQVGLLLLVIILSFIFTCTRLFGYRPDIYMLKDHSKTTVLQQVYTSHQIGQPPVVMATAVVYPHLLALCTRWTFFVVERNIWTHTVCLATNMCSMEQCSQYLESCFHFAIFHFKNMDTDVNLSILIWVM